MKKPELPGPIYAAAGVGELAYEQLRKLPAAAARTVRTAGQTADEVRIRLANNGKLSERLGERVRESAERGTSVMWTRAASAQERATTSYRNLVVRGERVVAERAARLGHEEPGQVEVIVGQVQSAERATAEEAAEHAAAEHAAGEREAGAGEDAPGAAAGVKAAGTSGAGKSGAARRGKRGSGGATSGSTGGTTGGRVNGAGSGN